MKKYAYFRVGWNLQKLGGGVFLRSTDTTTLEWILVRLEEKLKEAGKHSHKTGLVVKYCEFDGMKPGVNLNKLSNCDGTIALWIIKQLCDNGWEPFASGRELFVNTAGKLAGASHVALRRTIEEGEFNS